MWTEMRLRKNIALMLEHRFGALSPQTREGLETLPAEFLEELLIAVLDFKDVSEADAWIAQHRDSAHEV